MIIPPRVWVAKLRHDIGIELDGRGAFANRTDPLKRDAVEAVALEPNQAPDRRMRRVAYIDVVLEADGSRSRGRGGRGQHCRDRQCRTEHDYSPTSRYATSAGKRGMRCFCAQPRYSMPPPPVPAEGSGSPRLAAYALTWRNRSRVTRKCTERKLSWAGSCSASSARTMWRRIVARCEPRAFSRST